MTSSRVIKLRFIKTDINFIKRIYIKLIKKDEVTENFDICKEIFYYITTWRILDIVKYNPKLNCIYLKLHLPNMIDTKVATLKYFEKIIEGSDAIRGLALENGKNYCPNAKKDWKIKCC